MRSKPLTCLLLLCLLLGMSQLAVASDPESSPAAPQAPYTWYLPVSANKAVLGNPYTQASMVLISGGEFPMGCSALSGPDVCRSDETSLHLVWVDTFWMDRYEVTNGKYETGVLGVGCSPPELTTIGGQPYYGL
jgi:formylglycine-generating enzyme required for sulfatase activity